MFDWIIKESTASLYASPSVCATRVDEALCGMTAQILSENNTWAKLRMSYSYEGYIKKACVCPAACPSGERRIVYATAADVLTAPEVKAPLIQTLTTGCAVYTAPGDIAKSEVPKPGWSRVALPDGRPGYMRSAFLKYEMPPVDATALRERIIRTALLYRGTQYRWGGKSPLGIDCSGLCFMAYWLNGITIYRDARIEPGYPVSVIPFDAAQKGDLLFFPGHVGMYLGTGRMLHASEADNGVCVVPLTKERMKKMLTAGTVFDILPVEDVSQKGDNK